MPFYLDELMDRKGGERRKRERRKGMKTTV